MGPYALFQAGPARQRHPAAAVLPHHDDPAGHLRLDQDERAGSPARSLAPARHRPRLGRDPVGHERGISSTSTASRRTSTRRGTRAATTARIQYMVDGLKLQGCNPAFVRSRDAIIAAANVLGGGAAGENRATRAPCGRRSPAAASATAPSAATTNRDDNTEAFDTHPDCRQGFQTPVHAAVRDAERPSMPESAVPLKFTVSGATGLDVLMPTNSPFSRQVDCTTLRVPSDRRPDHAARVPAGHDAGPGSSRGTRRASTTTTGRPRRTGPARAARSWSPVRTGSSTAPSSSSSHRRRARRISRGAPARGGRSPLCSCALRQSGSPRSIDPSSEAR